MAKIFSTPDISAFLAAAEGRFDKCDIRLICRSVHISICHDHAKDSALVPDAVDSELQQATALHLIDTDWCRPLNHINEHVDVQIVSEIGLE